MHPPIVMSHNVLLHEILLALLGYTGDVIQPVFGANKQLISSYRVAPSLSIVSAGERQRIDAIVHLGSLYHQLHAFTTIHSHSQLSSSPSPPLYLTALSTAVSTVLTSYRSTVLQCEQAALSLPPSSPYPLSSLQQNLQPFTIILPSLASTVSLITTALHKHRQHQYYRRHLSLPADDDCFQYQGGLLLSLLHEQQQVGYPLLSELWRGVLQQSCAVLYTQLESWCLHGQLNDPDAEFFVRRRDRDRSKREEHGKAAQEEEEKETTTATAEEPQPQDSYAEVWDDFSLRPSLIPSFFSAVTASKVLFIGRAVNIMMLASSSASDTEDASPLFLSPAFLSFQSALSAVQAAPAFSMAALDAAVSRLDAHLTMQLSALLLSSSALLPHLQTLHSFLLLTDGHFLHFFLDAASGLLSRTPSPQANRELVAPLQSALAACNLLSHPHSALLSMQLDHSSFSYASFLPSHFISSSSSVSTASHSGLLPSPDTRLLQHTLRLHSTRRGERGAVFFSPRMLVEYGWETRFSFHVGDAASAARGAEEDRDACGLAFVLQNDREGALADYRRGGDGVGPLHVGIVNSLSVELSLHVLPSGARREQIAIYHFPHPPLASSAASLSTHAFRCLRSITGDWGLFDSRHHALSISYSSEDGDAPVVLVSVDSQPIPVLSVPLKLTSTLQLDGGRAWVGIVASTPPAGSSAVSTAPPHSVSLHSWSFAERLPASSPLLAWRNLRLAYRVSGPLSLILRPATLERYTALFRYLFSLQRCHHALQQSFKLLSSLRQQRTPLSAQSAHLVALRASLVFFVSAVHDHLYSDVIAPSFASLTRAVQAETDFLQVRRQHEEHLLRVATGCWLKDRLVSGALGELFALCDKAVDGMRQSEGGQADSGWVEAARLEFERLSCFLFTVLSRKQGVLANASLSSLLTRLNYNAYFSQLAMASGMRRLHTADTADRRTTLH